MGRVKLALRTRAELCSLADLYGAALANGRNDLSDLSRRGWVIRSWYEDHGVGSHKHYQLVSEPEAEQLTFQRRMKLVNTFSKGQR